MIGMGSLPVLADLAARPCCKLAAARYARSPLHTRAELNGSTLSGFTSGESPLMNVSLSVSPC